MPIQQWSEDILVVDLADEPEFNDDVQMVIDRAGLPGGSHVVINMSNLTTVNSSNLAALLRLRQKCVAQNRRLQLTTITDVVWGIILTTGLDKVFEFTADVPTALAKLQLDE